MKANLGHIHQGALRDHSECLMKNVLLSSLSQADMEKLLIL